MMVRVYWLIRVTAFAVIGILALINPPHSAAQQASQIACFSAVGLALLAWIAADVSPRYRARGLPVALGVMAVAGGVAAVTAGGGQSLVAFACIAACWAAQRDRPAGRHRGRRGRHRLDLGRRGDRRQQSRHAGRVSAADRGVRDVRPATAFLPGAGRAVRGPAGAARAAAGRAAPRRRAGRADPHRARDPRRAGAFPRRAGHPDPGGQGDADRPRGTSTGRSRRWPPPSGWPRTA